MYDLSVPHARDPLILVTVFAVLALITTGLRLKSLNLRGMSIGVDDYLMFAGLFFVISSTAIHYSLVLFCGIGRHVQAVRPEDLVKGLKIVLAFEANYGITMAFVKCSVIYFYYLLIILWAISTTLITFLICRPLAFNWDPTIVGGVCGDRNTVFVITGVINVVTDIMVLSLPLPHILKLQLAWRRKVGLLLMFSIGFLITAISIVRIIALRRMDFNDPTVSFQTPIIWTIIEPSLCIINGNLPMVRTCLAAASPRLFGTISTQPTPLGKIGPSTVSGSRNQGTEFQRIGDGGENDVQLEQIGSRITVEGGIENHAISNGSWPLTDGEILVGRRYDVETGEFRDRP
ncbi:hypothetical protein DL95DRAFT_457573 [Leptodontidium sp. 2 PMI_412]|nr:hypothetical protein DL95DRAFT_457573 [Leptodontidium sp. 2 PMI_412]